MVRNSIAINQTDARRVDEERWLMYARDKIDLRYLKISYVDSCASSMKLSSFYSLYH